MADATYAVVNKSKKAKRVEVDALCGHGEKEKNIITAETAFSDTESPVYYNSVALEKPAFEDDPKANYSVITSENMTPNESYHLSKAKDLKVKRKAVEKSFVGENMAADSQNDNIIISKNNSQKKLIACIIITMSVTFLIILICLIALFYEIATLKASQESA